MSSIDRPASQHPVGQLSPSGVLDVGLSCPHSCVFCYYSHFDDHEDQFHALRTMPWRKLEECQSLADSFRSWGLTHCDITGGEPTLHPQIYELVRYAEEQADIRTRIITLAQTTMRRDRRLGKRRIDALLDAGVSDFLFSFHAADPTLFKKLTGGDVDQVKATMEHLDALGHSYTANSVVQEYNFRHLPEIARYLAGRRVRFANFIVMKLEWGWRNAAQTGVHHKARYRQIAPYLTEAVSILEDAGKAVNIRFAPYCAFPGLERNIVGYKQIQLDPYEWRNGTRGSPIKDTPYGGKPFLFYTTLEEYLGRHPQAVDTRSEYNMRQGSVCSDCSLRSICDGVDRDYVDRHGWDEFQARHGPAVHDLTHFRKDYRVPYTMLGRRCGSSSPMPIQHASHTGSSAT